MPLLVRSLLTLPGRVDAVIVDNCWQKPGLHKQIHIVLSRLVDRFLVGASVDVQKQVSNPVRRRGDQAADVSRLAPALAERAVESPYLILGHLYRHQVREQLSKQDGAVS